MESFERRRLMNQWWKEAGKLLGYPPCCIEWFCSTPLNVIAEVGQRYGRDTGFVPCPKHHAQLESGMCLESLISSRSELLPPFPECPTMKEALAILSVEPWNPLNVED